MLDNVLSWAVILVAGWYMIWHFLMQAMDKQPSMKRTESDKITKIYRNL